MVWVELISVNCSWVSDIGFLGIVVLLVLMVFAFRIFMFADRRGHLADNCWLSSYAPSVYLRMEFISLPGDYIAPPN